MVVAARLAWLATHVSQGSDVRMAFSYNPHKRKTKVRFAVKPRRQGDLAHSPVMLHMLHWLQTVAVTTISCDYGHRHSTGVSTVTVWIQDLPDSYDITGADEDDMDSPGDDGLGGPDPSPKEPENEDDMNVDRWPATAVASSPPVAYVTQSRTFIKTASFVDDLHWAQCLQRSSSDTDVSALRILSDVADSAEEPDTKKVSTIELAPDIQGHIFRLSSHFAKIDELLADVPEHDRDPLPSQRDSPALSHSCVTELERHHCLLPCSPVTATFALTPNMHDITGVFQYDFFFHVCRLSAERSVDMLVKDAGEPKRLDASPFEDPPSSSLAAHFAFLVECDLPDIALHIMFCIEALDQVSELLIERTRTTHMDEGWNDLAAYCIFRHSYPDSDSE
eukprot:TRINITY_DN18406_c0_g1_i1.p1 TRINITY_DN18406_c0_g1~~TRINITY_DN18406_c0_g1_i1.p1  ORF type:complete len:392 (-),score=39.23 TRINITY_DN18406_c0_g1_i1:191-1366(-)